MGMDFIHLLTKLINFSTFIHSLNLHIVIMCSQILINQILKHHGHSMLLLHKIGLLFLMNLQLIIQHYLNLIKLFIIYKIFLISLVLIIFSILFNNQNLLCFQNLSNILLIFMQLLLDHTHI